jgi:hypothetical protein
LENKIDVGQKIKIMVRSDSYYSLYKEVLFLQAPEKPLQVENNASETNTTSVSPTW